MGILQAPFTPIGDTNMIYWSYACRKFVEGEWVSQLIARGMRTVHVALKGSNVEN